MNTPTAADLVHADADTRDHIATVQARIGEVIAHLAARAARHDISKLEEPERSGYAGLRACLVGMVYGSDEYWARLAAYRPTIDHHVAHNDHHPEHYATGICGMSLLSLLEMVADWKAAGERAPHGSMHQSLEVNCRRFAVDRQLSAILENTARELGWFTDPSDVPQP